MGPGDFFGEGGVVSAQPRGESVRAATPVKARKSTNRLATRRRPQERAAKGHLCSRCSRVYALGDIGYVN